MASRGYGAVTGGGTGLGAFCLGKIETGRQARQQRPAGALRDTARSALPGTRLRTPRTTLADDGPQRDIPAAGGRPWSER